MNTELIALMEVPEEICHGAGVENEFEVGYAKGWNACMNLYREKLKELEAEAQTAPQAPEVSQWRPIETAPSERNVLVWVGRVGMGSRSSGPYPRWRWNWEDGDHNPTQWMPLPEGPKS